MLQDIAPHRLSTEYRPSAPTGEDLVLTFTEAGGRVLVRALDERGRALEDPEHSPERPHLLLPRMADYERQLPERISSLRYLFRLDDRAVFLDTAPGDPELPGFAPQTIRLFRRGLPQELSFAGATAWHLRSWYRRSRFCGSCGAPCAPDARERAMRCTACGSLYYPRINPAVIIGVLSGDRIILSRYADGHQSSVYNASARTYRGRSLVAGYCEIGETVEDTVRREVMEEVGLRVRRITYYRSQPWGFDGALLMGFYCEVEGDDRIRRDPGELAEARWWHRDEIGEVAGTASLTNEMIVRFRDGGAMQ